MARLVFLQRTESEIKVFGGDVFFDIDGKNAGKLALSNQTVELPPGEHTIKMYKSHIYDTFIGFAEQTITLGENEILMVKYSCPMMISQPGNMVISDYSEDKQAEAIKNRDAVIQRDFVAIEQQKQQENDNYKNGVKIVIIVAVIIAVIIGVYEGILLSSI